MKTSFFLPLVLYFSAFCISQILNCEVRYGPHSGEIAYLRNPYYYRESKCWTIEVPGKSYISLELTDLSFTGYSCNFEYLRITFAGSDEEYIFCGNQRIGRPIKAYTDVNITYYFKGDYEYSTPRDYWRYSTPSYRRDTDDYRWTTWWPYTKDYWRYSTPSYRRDTDKDYWRPSTRDYWRYSTPSYRRDTDDYRWTTWRPYTKDYWRYSTPSYRQDTDNYWRPSTRDYWRYSTPFYRPNTYDYWWTGRPNTKDYWRYSTPFYRRDTVNYGSPSSRDYWRYSTPSYRRDTVNYGSPSSRDYWRYSTPSYPQDTVKYGSPSSRDFWRYSTPSYRRDTVNYGSPSSRDYWKYSTPPSRPNTNNYWRRNSTGDGQYTTPSNPRNTDDYWRPFTRDYGRYSTPSYQRETDDYWWRWRPSTRDYHRYTTRSYHRDTDDYWQSQPPYTKDYWRYSTPYYRRYTTSTPSYYTFRLKYKIESKICALKTKFRCSESQCVYAYQVCDGVRDCRNGADEDSCETGVTAIRGVDWIRKDAIDWLKRNRSPSFGWGKNTHRAITALFLSGGESFQSQRTEDGLMVKQLELQTTVALLRNSTDALTVNDLSMYINALSVVCHNPRQFYGYDLVQILEDSLRKWESPAPGAYLTLCIAGRPFTETYVRRLLSYLDQPSGYPFDLDIEAMTILALTCVKNKTNLFQKLENVTEIYDATVQKFIDLQKSDGSFGSLYTSALITQALIASGQEQNIKWNVTSTVEYLISKQRSSSDFLFTYLALPVFNGKTLVDLSSVNCSSSREQGDEDVSNIIGKIGGKMRIKYSLYVDDQKYIIHSLYLRMPENSTAYDVMKVAEVADPKYKFSHIDESGYMYVYHIAGISNDPEAGQFWHPYIGKFDVDGKFEPSSESPDTLVLQDGQHFVMWYKRVNVREKELNNLFYGLLYTASQ